MACYSPDEIVDRIRECNQENFQGMYNIACQLMIIIIALQNSINYKFYVFQHQGKENVVECVMDVWLMIVVLVNFIKIKSNWVKY